ncbi:MAG: sensor histidine kinase [Verrucomicrobia bacterium]|nr:sensor histidine kinase [Verrucomicrobiota bacterium]
MLRSRIVIATVCLLGAPCLRAQEARPQILTKCADVRGLTPDQAARGIPVRVKGVVTLVPADAPGSFTVDDGTGIWVGPPQSTPTGEVAADLKVGDVVEIGGRSHEGHFAPTISAHEVRILGRAPLPVARTIAQLGLESGMQDSQRVSISGVVHAAENVRRGGRAALSLLISTPTGHCNFLLYDQGVAPATSLVDSEVSLTGVFLAYFNSRREFLGVRIFSNDPADLRILRAPEADAFAAPEVALGEAMGFSSRGMDVHRRRVRGTVTLSKPGHYFYVQDKQHALRINTRQPDPLQPGDVVEATGFFQLNHHRSEMHEAIFRRIGRTVAPEPEVITREHAFVREPRAMYSLPQDYDDTLVALRGRLVSVEHKQGEPLRLNLECDGVLVPAEFTDAQDAGFVAALRLDSELLVSGICALTFSQSRPVVDWPTPVALRLLLRGPADVRVMQAASWWTPERLSAALGLTAVVLLIAFAWVALLRRQVVRRSAQLAEEMRARRDAVVEFESTLRERNRLAADLHDTTEQTLTGLALQLEATEALRGRAPERSLQHLALARQLLDRSREDLRRSIWNLRASPLEKNTLTEALREVAADRSSGTTTRIVVECDGTQTALPDFVAGNLLLLAQEGITNALKHARPAQIDLILRFVGRAVTLIIRDDGAGFDPATVDGPKDGHFGLQGMRERIKRLGGQLEIKSVRDTGTTITATVPQVDECRAGEH